MWTKPLQYSPALLLCLTLLFLFACSSSDNGPGQLIERDAGTDTGTDVGFDDASDTDDVDTGDDDVDTGPPPTAAYCENCIDDSDCIEDGAMCVTLPDGESVCGSPCDPDSGVLQCDEDSRCITVDQAGNAQCLPELLTCVDDRCDNIACPAGYYCNPFDGECAREPGICDTGCQFDAECGDPATSRCLVTPAPDGETMCTTTCDPNVSGEDVDLECPSDFACVALEEEGDEGVCFPMMLTCIDRCYDVDCPAGHNCDPLTGDCVEAIAGACDAGCENDAECGGQDDMCLHLGIGDEAHCWQDCTSDLTCPDGYDCLPLLGLTNNLCIPINQSCNECSDADCFPEGICDPTTGECTPHPENCNIEGCDDGAICEPISARCTEIDSQCRGESWAVDCDNVVTRCTSQRPGVDGKCAVICFDDDDCSGDRTCESTQYGDLCMGPDFGGPSSCGVIGEFDADIGQPCGEGASTCSPGHFCVEAGHVPGFCSQSCQDDADCPGDATCGVGPEGEPICIPAQCQCAGNPALSPALDDGWHAALDEAWITACDLHIPAEAFEQAGDWTQRAFVDDSLQNLLANPPAGIGTARQAAESLDGVADTPAWLLSEATTLLDFHVDAPQPYPAASVDLVDVIDSLVSAADGSVDAAEVEDELEDVPAEVQVLAARIVDAIDVAYRARSQAFDDAGLDDATLQTLFDQTHRLFLPHDGAQQALDLDDPDVAAAIDAFPLAELVQIGADLAATIDEAIDDAALDPADFDEPFSAVIDTPAGAIVIGDTGDNVYSAADFDEPFALILEIGGDNEYEVPVAANQSVENGVSILVDLDGADTYTYPKVGHADDGDYLMVSDDAGRAASGNNGPVSMSETARQGFGRLGIGLLFDRGAGEDTYQTLRMGQGAAVLGVGAIFDGGDDPTHFEAEAFAQGAAFYGVGLLYSQGGDNTYRLWHAGQGFGAAGGVGLLYDREGDDEYTAVTGVGDDGLVAERVIYHSPADGNNANRSLVQGASAGADGVAAGLGILRDASGDDAYLSDSYAQGYGEALGLGLLVDADGDDTYHGRDLIHGTGSHAGAGLLIDTGGDDQISQTAAVGQLGQGAGEILGWGALVVEGGENHVDYHLDGGAIARNGGMGFAFFDGGPNEHDAGGGLGHARFTEDDDSPLALGLTAAFFIQTGAQEDIYSHPDPDDAIANDAIWRQEDDFEGAIGVGLDQ